MSSFQTRVSLLESKQRSLGASRSCVAGLQEGSHVCGQVRQVQTSPAGLRKLRKPGGCEGQRRAEPRWCLPGYQLTDGQEQCRVSCLPTRISCANAFACAYLTRREHRRASWPHQLDLIALRDTWGALDSGLTRGQHIRASAWPLGSVLDHRTTFAAQGLGKGITSKPSHDLRILRLQCAIDLLPAM